MAQVTDDSRLVKLCSKLASLLQNGSNMDVDVMENSDSALLKLVMNAQFGRGTSSAILRAWLAQQYLSIWQDSCFSKCYKLVL